MIHDDTVCAACGAALEEEKVPDVYTTHNDWGQTGEVRNWASLIDGNALRAAEAVSRVPIVHGHLALMPDAHFGFGPPVGSAFVMKGGIMPYAVGVDIGCGMIAVKTDVHREEVRGSEEGMLALMAETIPSGVGTSHNSPTRQSEKFFHENGPPPGLGFLQNPRKALQRARIQFGTLGSGNHFVEVCKDAEGYIWLLLHSGSRGIGNMLAQAHVRRAKEVARVNGVHLEDKNFSYFFEGTSGFGRYIEDMLWAQNYALMQREAMMDALRIVLWRHTKPLEFEQAINCHHNYAEEVSDGWLVRKGAINAEVGRLGIIPGSMGASTFIVEGLGNPEAYNTAPHGAGRLKGRGDAKRTLDVEEFKDQMGDRVWQADSAGALLDEAPDAYKPIGTVIKDSETLVKPVTILEQFINYKGV